MTTKQKTAALLEVANKIAARECQLEIAKSCINPVPGSGDVDAQIVFVGEAPGAKEDLLGEPFVGASGKMLDQMLATIGLQRSDVFVTNIVKYRPPNNRDPNKQEIAACLPYLFSQIDIIKPKLVVLLGRHSMNVFFPELKIAEVHGVVRHQRERVFLPLYHPAAALYNGSLRATLLADFAQIPNILQSL